ncbi:sulfate transporter 3.1 [Prunus yedoensis var. nudiflora]|uniref:Sulfate transporter 3.1 n=1 Tax=Prunus yedoensis var. nudiflora TaxID=2094558 RepID=A0A314ZP74_PRUYE|nr:sulfate transporter 3.1 [Prunus yedoensis var. nudiflora]
MQDGNVKCCHGNCGYVHIVFPHSSDPLHSPGCAVCYHNSTMLGLIDYEAAIHLWKVAISVIRVLLFVARPRTFVQGNLPNSMVYRNVEQYPNASNVPGILILEIDAPIYFANTNYFRERITRWINDEEDRIKSAGESSLQYVILDMTCN